MRYFQWYRSRLWANSPGDPVLFYLPGQLLFLQSFFQRGGGASLKSTTNFIGIVCGYNWAKLLKKIHQKEREKISIYLLTLTSQKSEKQAWNMWGYSFKRRRVWSCDAMYCTSQIKSNENPEKLYIFYKYNFFTWTLKEWNTLPTFLLNQPSVDAFKSAVTNYLSLSIWNYLSVV